MSPALLPTLIRHLRRPTGADPTADAELVRRYAALRDEEAFAELLRRHGPLVWGVCRRRLPNRADAEDAFQSTFLVLAKRAAAIRRPEALGCWLYGVAHRVAGRMRGRPVLTVPKELPSAAVPVAEAATVREFLAALDEELLRLPEKLRGPLVLCFLQERTQDEAAKQLRVSLSTLKRRLDGGRELLRVRLAGRGVELSVALAAAGLTVPAAVADAAVRVVVDGVSAGVVSVNVLTVTEGVVRAMTYAKLKAWTAGILMVTAAAGGTGYFTYTGYGQAGGAGPADKQAGKPDPALRFEVLKAEAEFQIAEAEVVKAQAKLRESPTDRVAQAELQVARARLEATKVQLEATRARAAARQEDLARDKQAADRREADRVKPREQLARAESLRQLRQEKLKVAREMLALVTERSRLGRNPFPDVYEWSKRVFVLEQEVDPSPAARLLAAKEHYTRMRKLQDRVQTSTDPLDWGTVGLYRLEAETWAKEAEARRAARPEPAHEGAAAPTEVERLRQELDKVKVEAAVQRQRAELLDVFARKLNEELGEYGREQNRGNPPPVPEGFRGTVRRVEGTAKDLANGREVWIEITPGADAGLKPGAILSVRRISGASGKYLGTITVARVNTKDAIGRFKPTNPRAATDDDLPKPGDQLVLKAD